MSAEPIGGGKWGLVYPIESHITVHDGAPDGMRQHSLQSGMTTRKACNVSGTELPGIPTASLKARVLDTVYEEKYLRVLDGFQLLAAEHLKTNVGIIVVNGDFGRGHYQAAIAEAERAGLKTQRFYVYAESATYSGRDVCVTLFADIWPTA
ncbi:hypothetical protein [Acidovorax sp. sic0104]|uniref:hypothetical protein n=1 Tax=Acidovorax sp. sic0104 TaxID=2854784 RepID=UPI001C47C802|nr:hypothetical protein [Acidovorax sp. sic0104]